MYLHHGLFVCAVCLRLLGSVQLIVHLGELVLQVSDLSLVLLFLHFYLVESETRTNTLRISAF